jgi:hypothetical protein
VCCPFLLVACSLFPSQFLLFVFTKISVGNPNQAMTPSERIAKSGAIRSKNGAAAKLKPHERPLWGDTQKKIRRKA